MNEHFQQHACRTALVCMNLETVVGWTWLVVQTAVERNPTGDGDTEIVPEHQIWMHQKNDVDRCPWATE